MQGSILQRSKHRKLIQWSIAYLAGAWVFLQLIDLLASPFRIPDAVLRSATVVAAVGFFALLVVAWYHGEKGQQKVTPREIMLLIVILIIAGVGVAFVGRTPAVTSERAVVEHGSIAVLPFLNMSSDAEQEYFSDGLTEELLNVLAKVPEVRVASRTSSFTYKGSKASIDSIARALRVEHVLEGSVRKSGDRIRITAQLIRADNGYHVWSNTYDLTMSDVFAIQDEISKAIVEALAPKLNIARNQMAKTETQDAQAHTLVMKGVHFAKQSTRDSYRRAVTLFLEAIERDPAYARAYAELSRAYSQQAYHHFGPRAVLVQRAKDAAERALKLDPSSAEAHYARAEIARVHDWDFRTAEVHFRRAVELRPGLAAPHSTHGWLLAEFGRTEAALAAAKRAAQLDPASPGMLGNLGNLGAVYTLTGRFGPAIATYRKALEIEPTDAINLGNLALTYSYANRHREAVDAAEHGIALAPEDQYNLTVLAYTYGRAGRRDDALAAIRKLEAQPEPAPYFLATVYAGLDERERVLSLLERAVADKDPAAPDMGVDPTFASYRKEARVQRLLARMGLT